MDAQKVDMYLMTNSKYFESHQIQLMRDRMLQMDDNKFIVFSSLEFKDPTMILVVSIFVGHLGIDRFILGDVGVGLAKLFTCGGFGIWTIVDWFMIMRRTREVNFDKFIKVL
jgi:TM2 domain-containing membrane protein YozV